jgi:hypothetical protein
MLLQQQSIMDKLERGKILCNSAINMAVINQSNAHTMPATLKAQLSEILCGR